MFPKKDPSEGSVKTPTWSLENFKDGGTAAGWLEGPLVWLDTHHYFVTVPCHSFLTGGTLKCPHCMRGRPVEESAYVAWLEESGKPMCTCLKKYARPILAKVKPNDPIALGKGKRKTDPIWVKPRSGSYRFTPTPGSERTQEQFEHWLLRVWKVPELFEFFRTQPAAPAVDPGRRGRAPLYTPEQEREIIRGALTVVPRIGQDDPNVPLEDILPSLAAMRNGVAKKKE